MIMLESFASKIGDAAINTVICICVVFCVLIFISWIISLLGNVNKIGKKKEEETRIVTEAVDNTVSQIVEKEELADDLELVAVISAAIAAATGSSTDSFVVRSVRKKNRTNWINA